MVVLQWKILWEWMMNRGTPISGNLSRPFAPWIRIFRNAATRLVTSYFLSDTIGSIWWLRLVLIPCHKISETHQYPSWSKTGKDPPKNGAEHRWRIFHWPFPKLKAGPPKSQPLFLVADGGCRIAFNRCTLGISWNTVYVFKTERNPKMKTAAENHWECKDHLPDSSRFCWSREWLSKVLWLNDRGQHSIHTI